jgi:aminomethyltransferase
MLDLARVFGYLATCRWFRRIRANGRLDLGGYDYYLGTSLRNQMLEVHFDARHSRAVWKAIMEAGAQSKIVPCGQAALESLRQEAGYVLVGNDHDRNTNPFEAGIGWTIKFAKSDFNGKQALKAIAREGIKRTLVWFRLPGGEIAKTGDMVFRGDREVGKVTSGSFSPTFNMGTAMGYVSPQFSIHGTIFEIEVAGKRCPAKLSVMPLFDPGNWITKGRP